VPEDADGQELWQELVRGHDNFEMVFNGHFGGDGAGFVGSRGDGGNTVYQMFFNTQFQTNGGTGWLRLVEFLDDGRTARVRTYSPYLDLYRTDPANQFEISLTAVVAGDFNGDLVVDLADYTVWRDRLGSSDLMADANGDNVVDGADYEIWKNNFGRSVVEAAASATAIPEPSAVTIMLAVCLAGLLSRLRTATIRQGHV
jgi:hypothetical protein